MGTLADLKLLLETQFVKEKALFLDELSFKQKLQVKKFQIRMDLKLIKIRFKHFGFKSVFETHGFETENNGLTILIFAKFVPFSTWEVRYQIGSDF